MPGGSKEEECNQKAQAIFRTFQQPATNKMLGKDTEADLIALEEDVIARGGEILRRVRGR